MGLFDRINANDSLQAAIGWSHVTLVALITGFFFFKWTGGQDGQAWFVVSPGPERTREVAGVLVPGLLVLFLISLGWVMASEVLDAVRGVFRSSRKNVSWVKQAKSWGILAYSIIMIALGLSILLANKTALDVVAGDPATSVLLAKSQLPSKASSRIRSKLVSQDAGDEESERWPAVNKALADDRLPWGRVAQGLGAASKVFNKGAKTAMKAAVEMASGEDHDSQLLKEDHHQSGGLSMKLFTALQPWRMANVYGPQSQLPGPQTPLADRKGGRDELIVEGNPDENCASGEGHWLEYEFRYKPGLGNRPPGFAGLHIPRLDWQMSLQALQPDWRTASWFPAVLRKLFIPSGVLQAMMAPSAAAHQGPPQCLRVNKYDMAFSGWGKSTLGIVFGLEKGVINQTKTDIQWSIWWDRMELGPYTPEVQAEGLDCSPKPECLPEAEGSSDEGAEGSRRRLLGHGDWGKLGNMVDGGVGPGAGHAAGDEKTDGIARAPAMDALSNSIASLGSFTSQIENKILHRKPSPSAPSPRVREVHQRRRISRQAQALGKKGFQGLRTQPLRTKDQVSESKNFHNLLHVGARNVHAEWKYLKGLKKQVSSIERKKISSLAGVGTASYILEKEVENDWGTGLVPDYLRELVLTLALLAGGLWVVWGMVSWMDWDEVADKLTSTDQRETVQYGTMIIGVIGFALIAGGLFAAYAIATLTVAGLGLVVAFYMVDVDAKIAESESYVSTCDITDKMSCTAAARSPSSSLVFGVKNAIWGCLYYLIVIAMVVLYALSGYHWCVLIIFVLSVCGVLASIYMMQIGFVTLKVVCPVCLISHVINFSMLWLATHYVEYVRWQVAF